MYKIPQDIEDELQKKHPNVHIGLLIQDLISGIINKAFKDGACTIREFGSFVSFVTYSGKVNSNVVRFKFRLANSLREKIKDDEYLLENLPIKSQYEFTDKHQQKCNTELKLANIDAISSALSLENKKKKNLETDELIREIIQDDPDENEDSKE
jgi:hypothetical protein